jgi:hypothetical protein
MYALYDPDGNPFMTGAAAALNGVANADARDAYARVAERLLGLTAPAFTDPADVQTAKDAVALQVSYLVMAGTNIFIAKSETRGARSITYRDDIGVHSLALSLVTGLLQKYGRTTGMWDPSNWPTITSVRPMAPWPAGTALVPLGVVAENRV